MYTYLPIILAVIVIFSVASVFIVDQQTAAIVARLGRFLKICKPGLNFKIPFIDQVTGRVNLRIRQLDVDVETKTYDDVFVRIVTSVQYCILPQRIYEAFYTLENAEQQIQAFIFDVVRARVPAIKLDDVFAKKDEIAITIQTELKQVMEDFGYNIIKALVTDIHPDARVKTAMNEINEAQRLRVAANERGEAEKILRVKQAEAEAESKILQGQGIAGQRKAIAEGLKDSLDEFQRTIHGATTHDVMSLIMMSQYFDTLKELGHGGKLNTILIPHSPSTPQDLYDQIRNSIIVGNEVARGE